MVLEIDFFVLQAHSLILNQFKVVGLVSQKHDCTDNFLLVILRKRFHRFQASLDDFLHNFLVYLQQFLGRLLENRDQVFRREVHPRI